MQRIAVVDYGMGNLRSVAKALEHVAGNGTEVVVTQDPAVIGEAEKVVFPGQGAIRDCMAELDRFAGLTGRQNRLFDYGGASDAERVIGLMGSGVGAVSEAVDALAGQGERVGVLAVRLYRPFDGPALVAARPESVRSIAVRPSSFSRLNCCAGLNSLSNTTVSASTASDSSRSSSAFPLPRHHV